MTAYSKLYDAELTAHRETKRELVRANDLICVFREFIRAKGMHQEILEYILVKHLGEDKAREILGDAAEIATRFEEASHSAGKP